MAIQLKSGLILLDGGQVANDSACCCGIDFGACTCDGLNTITVTADDNFGFSPSTTGSYASGFTPSAFGCSFAAKSPLYDAGPLELVYAWRVRAPIVLSGGLLRVRLDWFDRLSGGLGVIDVPYLGGAGPWRFTRSPGNYIDIALVC